MKKLLTSSCLLILFYSFASAPIYAHYEYNGADSGNLSSLDVKFGTGMTLTTDDNDSYTNIASEGFFKWTEALDYNVLFNDVSGVNGFDIYVQADDYGNVNWTARNFHEEDAQGITYYDSITCNTYHMDGYDLDWNSGIFAHEVGHALGLAHTNDNTTHLMCQAGSGRTVTVPHDHEVAGVNNLYGF